MSRESIVFLVGVVVFFTPFLGVPSDWKQYVIAGAGVILMVVGYSLRRSSYFRRIDIGNGERKTESFVESKVPDTKEEQSEDTQAEISGTELKT